MTQHNQFVPEGQLGQLAILEQQKPVGHFGLQMSLRSILLICHCNASRKLYEGYQSVDVIFA